MKKTLLLFMMLLYIHIGEARIIPCIDERFELTSITFALAGVPEFCESKISSYFRDLDYFTPYELTEPINYVRKLNQEYKIGYNAVANVTAFLEIKKGRVTLRSDISNLAEIDSRWNEKLLTEYIRMLNRFYKESKFDVFFNNHKELYKIAEERMGKYFANINLNEWLNSFYGRGMNQDLNIYISLINGRHNYAFPGGVIIGVIGDEEGLPTPNLQSLPILVHEILHHYTNSIFFAFWDEMKDTANKIYPFINKEMTKIAYFNAQTMALEWLNNLFVLTYLKQINYETMEFNLAQDMQKGFIWMQRSMDFMDNFNLNRERYMSIEKFMPQLISFFKYIANNFDLVIKEYEYLSPFITNIFPAPNTSLIRVDEIIITFSQPMNGSYGFCGVPSGCEPLPVDFNKVKWSDDKCSFIMKLNSETKKYNCKYGVKLNPNAFQSSKYYNLNNNVDCDLVFY